MKEGVEPPCNSLGLSPSPRTMFQGGTKQAHAGMYREWFRHAVKDEDKVVRRNEHDEKMEQGTKKLENPKQRKEDK